MWISPEQKVTKATGSGLLKGVHLELVAVVVGFLRPYIRSRTQTVEREQRDVSVAAGWFVVWIKEITKVVVLIHSSKKPLKVTWVFPRRPQMDNWLSQHLTHLIVLIKTIPDIFLVVKMFPVDVLNSVSFHSFRRNAISNHACVNGEDSNQSNFEMRGGTKTS